jgi:subfamily B ATP-binding cassette protein MsbA
VRKLTSVNNMIQTSVASAERVFEMLDAEPDIVESPGATRFPPCPRHPLRQRPPSPTTASRGRPLDNIDLDIRKGRDDRPRRLQRRGQEHAGQD